MAADVDTMIIESSNQLVFDRTWICIILFHALNFINKKKALREKISESEQLLTMSHQTRDLEITYPVRLFKSCYASRQQTLLYW